MEDETPKDEIEEVPPLGEEDGEEETQEETFESYESRRPYVNYTALARRGSILSSPIGLAVAGILISKGMDLAYRAFMEREKTERMKIQQNPK